MWASCNFFPGGRTVNQKVLRSWTALRDLNFYEHFLFDKDVHRSLPLRRRSFMVPLCVIQFAYENITVPSECRKFVNFQPNWIHAPTLRTFVSNKKTFPGREHFGERNMEEGMIIDIYFPTLRPIIIEYKFRCSGKGLGLFQGYLRSLGCTRTAQVKCQARIGEAEALRDSVMRVKQNTKAKQRKKKENPTACVQSPAPSLRQSILSSLARVVSLLFMLHCSQYFECITMSGSAFINHLSPVTNLSIQKLQKHQNTKQRKARERHKIGGVTFGGFWKVRSTCLNMLVLCLKKKYQKESKLNVSWW